MRRFIAGLTTLIVLASWIGIHAIYGEDIILNPSGCTKKPATVQDACPDSTLATCFGTNCTPAGVGGCEFPAPFEAKFFDVVPFADSSSSIENPAPVGPGESGYAAERIEGSQILCFERRPCECAEGENGNPSECKVTAYLYKAYVVAWQEKQSPTCMGPE